MNEKPLAAEQFVLLIARHERRVRSFIAMLAAGRADVVDEVLQATYLVAWQKLDSFTYLESNPDEELIRWMCTIARFEVLNYSRRYGRSWIAFSAELIDQLAEVVSEESDYIESRQQALRGCLAQLPSRQRAMLGERYWSGLSIEELANRRGQAVGAIYTALSRIRKALERCIRHSLSEKGYSQ